MLECHARVCLTGAGPACVFYGYAIGWIQTRVRLVDSNLLLRLRTVLYCFFLLLVAFTAVYV
jgi:hypothetical protein